MQQRKDTTQESSQRTPLRFPKAFIDPTAKKGEFMTREEEMKFLGVTPQGVKRVELQLEYNETTDPARKEELLKMMNNYDKRKKAWLESQK